jgi:hypothetical protein
MNLPDQLEADEDKPKARVAPAVVVLCLPPGHCRIDAGYPEGLCEE